MNKLKYRQHRADANKRNIPFLISFEDWSNIWEQSGHWEERGRKSGQYCMSRYGDVGPYEVGNVFIQLHSANTSQAHKDKKVGPATDAHKKANSESVTKWWADRKAAGLGKHTDETRQKMSQDRKGTIQSEEHKRKNSEGVKAYWARRKAQQ